MGGECSLWLLGGERLWQVKMDAQGRAKSEASNGRAMNVDEGEVSVSEREVSKKRERREEVLGDEEATAKKRRFTEKHQEERQEDGVHRQRASVTASRLTLESSSRPQMVHPTFVKWMVRDFPHHSTIPLI